MRAQFRELVEADNTAVYLNKGEIPYAVGIVDGTVQLAVCDEVGTSRALVETDNKRLRGWLESRFAAYREESTLLPIETPPDRCTPKEVCGGTTRVIRVSPLAFRRLTAGIE